MDKILVEFLSCHILKFYKTVNVTWRATVPRIPKVLISETISIFGYQVVHSFLWDLLSDFLKIPGVFDT